MFDTLLSQTEPNFNIPDRGLGRVRKVCPSRAGPGTPTGARAEPATVRNAGCAPRELNER